jgi:thiol-disulfide isomerase/thioredoxin
MMVRYFFATLLCSFRVFEAFSIGFADTATFHLRGEIAFLSNADSVQLKVHRYSPYFDVPSEDMIRYCKVRNHRFSFSFKVVDSVEYVDLAWPGFHPGKIRTLSYYPVRAGDSIIADFRMDTTIFSGKGANIFTAFYRVKAIGDSVNHLNNGATLLETVLNFMRLQDSIVLRAREFLFSRQAGIGPKAARSLVSDISVRAEIAKLRELGFFYRTIDFQNQLKDSICHREDSNANTFIFSSLRNDLDRYERLSRFYPDFVAAKIHNDSAIFSDNYKLVNCIQFISKNFAGRTREEILVRFIYKHRGVGANTDNPGEFKEAVLFADSLIQHGDLRGLLVRISNGVLRSNEVYGLPLVDRNGRRVFLSKFLGKPILVHFWFTGCGNCKQVVPLLDSMESDFAKTGLVSVAISIDHDMKLWRKSLAKGEYSTKRSVSFMSTEIDGFDPFISYFNIAGCPMFAMIGKTGHVEAILVDPRVDGGRRMKSEISRVVRM